jgi:hypothetical protein
MAQSAKHTALLRVVTWLSQPNTLHYFGPCNGSVSQTHHITSGRAKAQSAKHTALIWALPWLSRPNTPYYFGPCHGSVSQTHRIISGRAMAQVLNCDILTWRPVKYPGTECRICGGQGDTRPGHSQSTSVPYHLAPLPLTHVTDRLEHGL